MYESIQIKLYCKHIYIYIYVPNQADVLHYKTRYLINSIYYNSIIIYTASYSILTSQTKTISRSQAGIWFTNQKI